MKYYKIFFILGDLIPKSEYFFKTAHAKFKESKFDIFSIPLAFLFVNALIGDSLLHFSSSSKK
jgi:hypothetical protein